MKQRLDSQTKPTGRERQLPLSSFNKTVNGKTTTNGLNKGRQRCT